LTTYIIYLISILSFAACRAEWGRARLYSVKPVRDWRTHECPG